MVEARRSILVVEDDPETARQLADSLTTNGYQVDLAATGKRDLFSLSSIITSARRCGADVPPTTP